MRLSNAALSLRAKISSEYGETIVETLVSILISSLALLLLATAVGVSVNIVISSRAKMEELYLQESKVIQESSPVAGSSYIDSDIPLGESSKVEVNAYMDNDGSVLYYEKKS